MAATTSSVRFKDRDVVLENGIRGIDLEIPSASPINMLAFWRRTLGVVA